MVSRGYLRAITNMGVIYKYAYEYVLSDIDGHVGKAIFGKKHINFSLFTYLFF